MADNYSAPKINSPDFACAAYSEQRTDVVIVQDCYKGTSAIRAKGRTYLRKFSAEDQRDFDVRLESSKFWNAFRRTVHGLVGLIFRKNPIIDQNAPEEIKKQLQDVDLQGAHVDVFAKERCLRGMIDGHSFIYVDMEKSVLEDNPNATLAEEKAKGLRPYWVTVDKDQVRNWRTAKVNGIEKLTQVTICEYLMEPEGDFGEKKVTQYRVLRPGEWLIYRQNSETKEWSVSQQGKTSLNYIPLVPFYALQTGYFCSTPLLLDVAHENIRHYNLQSGLDRAIDTCNMPTPILKGRPESRVGTPFATGGVVDIPENGDAKYLEPTGNAIPGTQNEIDRCKANIASLGLLLLSSQPKVTKTATETTVEYTAETSELSAIARNLQDCLERCLIINADYMKQPGSWTLKVNKDFVKLGIDPQMVQRLQDDVANNRLTLDSYFKILEGAEVYYDGFDSQKEKDALDKQETLTKLQMERAKIGLAADKQAMAGNPAEIASRIIEGANQGAAN
jgi:uncharacterized protein DUF4055